MATRVARRLQDNGVLFLKILVLLIVQFERKPGILEISRVPGKSPFLRSSKHDMDINIRDSFICISITLD